MSYQSNRYISVTILADGGVVIGDDSVVISVRDTVIVFVVITDVITGDRAAADSHFCCC